MVLNIRVDYMNIGLHISYAKWRILPSIVEPTTCFLKRKIISEVIWYSSSNSRCRQVWECCFWFTPFNHYPFNRAVIQLRAIVSRNSLVNFEVTRQNMMKLLIVLGTILAGKLTFYRIFLALFLSVRQFSHIYSFYLKW